MGVSWQGVSGFLQAFRYRRLGVGKVSYVFWLTKRKMRRITDDGKKRKKSKKKAK